MPGSYHEPQVEVRLALLLSTLVESTKKRGSLPYLTTRDIRDRLVFYRWTPDDSRDEDSKRELLRKDIDRLTERGWVVRAPDPDGDPDDDGRSRPSDIIELQMPEKPERLFLSEEEHAAIARVRAALRGPHELPIVSPMRMQIALAADATIADNALDAALATARYLEESGGRVEVGILQAHLEEQGVPNASRVARKALRVLDQMADYLAVETRDPGIVFGLSGDTVEYAEASGAVPARQQSNRRHSPGGLNVVNRPAYTPAEAAERLELIGEALASPERWGESDLQLLRSAQSRIAAWSDILHAIR